MRIGIDISQVAYKGTGVATYVRNIVLALLSEDHTNFYTLVGFSLRQRGTLTAFIHEAKAVNPDVKSVLPPFPQTILRVLWNNLHIVPVEWFTGPLDVFWSSDWTTPPLIHARGITTIHDLIVFRYPGQFDRSIVDAQKKRLFWAVREYDAFLCDSEATLQDALTFLSIHKNKLRIVYPGMTQNV